MPVSDIQFASMTLRKERRVVVFADLVESVRLMQNSETDAIQRWLHFTALARERIVPAQGGRLVRTTGDGLLLEFPLAPSAVAAVFDLQACLATCNDGHAHDETMWLRVGMHITEAVAADNDLHGAGVNLAARLGSLAQPGQTVCSVELRSQLTHGVHADIEDIGMHYLKHLPEPVHAFKLRPPGSDMAVGDGANAAPNATVVDMRPALAVVPFTCHPADPNHDALGYAMADDIIAALARHPGLRVLSRMSTAALRDTTLDLPRLQTLLGATYLLTGRFYMQGSRVRTSVELCDMRSGEVLWTGRAMAEVAALFEGQDDLVPHVVSNVSQTVLARELSRVRSLPMTTLESFSLFIGATGLMNSLVAADFRRSKEVLDHLAERYPRQASPNAMLAQWHTLRIVQGWADDAKEAGRQMQDFAKRAIDLGPDQASAMLAMGTAQVFLEGDFAAAGIWFERARQADPSDPMAWARLSESQSEAGQHALALASIDQAISLSPLDQRRHMFEANGARAAVIAGQYEKAIAFARNSVHRHILHAMSHELLIVALWLNGQQTQAKAATTRLRAALPHARVGKPSRTPIPGTNIRYTDALTLAGLPP